MSSVCARWVCGRELRGGHLERNSPKGPFSKVRGPQQRGLELYC